MPQQNVMSHNYYERLGIASTATDREIKVAYLKSSRDYHPDKNRDNPKAEEIFQGINSANTTLSDPHERKKHDLYLGFLNQLRDYCQKKGKTEEGIQELLKSQNFLGDHNQILKNIFFFAGKKVVEKRDWSTLTATEKADSWRRRPEDSVHKKDWSTLEEVDRLCRNHFELFLWIQQGLLGFFDIETIETVLKTNRWVPLLEDFSAVRERLDQAFSSLKPILQPNDPSAPLDIAYQLGFFFCMTALFSKSNLRYPSSSLTTVVKKNHERVTDKTLLISCEDKCDFFDYLLQIEEKIVFRIQSYRDRLLVNNNPKTREKITALNSALSEIQTAIRRISMNALSNVKRAPSIIGRDFIDVDIRFSDKRAELHAELQTILKKYAQDSVICHRRNPIRAFFKGLLGALLCIPTAGLPLFSRDFRCRFFSTASRRLLNQALDVVSENTLSSN